MKKKIENYYQFGKFVIFILIIGPIVITGNPDTVRYIAELKTYVVFFLNSYVFVFFDQLKSAD